MAGTIQGERSPISLNKEVNWERLDKTKFFVVGTGLFSGVTVLLFPLSVIKTRMQVSSSKTKTALSFSETVRDISMRDGVRGFYRGFSTVICGTIPARCVYLSTLELTKASVLKALSQQDMNITSKAWVASGLAGLCASMATQLVVVPVDVVSSRLMTQGMADMSSSGNSVVYKGGLDALRTIVRVEGVRGLYRGFSISLLTYAPSSATWWSTYGASQQLLWSAVHWGYDKLGRGSTPGDWTVVGVQAFGGACAGSVSALVTTPLDTVKTRIQVLKNKAGESPSFRAVVSDLVREDGVRGFYRGFVPRWASVSLWGTCMVTTYEFLKRLAAKQDKIVT